MERRHNTDSPRSATTKRNDKKTNAGNGERQQMTTQINDDVKRQDAANAEAQRQFEAERARKNAIQNAAKELRLKGQELARANKIIRDEVAGFKEVCNADLLELQATNAALTLEGAELKKKLATLKMLAGVK
jgi:hypothetical protein